MSYGGFGGRGGGGGGSSEVMLVESINVGRIIGRGGQKIRDLENESHARVKIARDEDENGMKSVEISGTDEEIESAKAIIQDYLSQGNDFGGGRRGGGGRSGGGFGRKDDSFGRSRDDGFGRRDRDGGDGWGRRNDYGDRGGGRGGFGGDRGGFGGDSETIYVESTEVGRIIGKGGNRIREMEQDSGCRIKVSKERTNRGHNSVELSGNRTQIADAKRLIQDAGVDIMNSDEQEQGRGW